MIRLRIGRLLKTDDTWYQISWNTDLETEKTVQLNIINNAILPYFGSINSDEQLLEQIEKRNIQAPVIARLFMLGKLQKHEDFLQERNKLLMSRAKPQLKEAIDKLSAFFNITI